MEKQPRYQEKYDQAQQAILDVISAFIGSGIPQNKAEHAVLKAAGNARTPDAVSRAIRARISPKLIAPYI